MKEFFWKITFSACALFSAGASATEDPKVLYASSDPSSEQFYIEMTGGVSLLLDRKTDRIYLNRPSQPQVSQTLAHAVEGTSDDPQVRADNLAKLRATLSNPDFLVTIRTPRVATDDSIWVRPNWEWCGEFACISPYSPDGPKPMVSTTGSRSRMCDHYLCPELPFPCEHGPCSVSLWGDLLFYSGWGAGWDDSRGGGSVTQQELIALDRSNFERQREGACEDKGKYGASTALTGLGMAAACVSGALPVCLSAGAGFGISMGELNEAHQQCEAGYPGLGRW